MLMKFLGYASQGWLWCECVYMILFTMYTIEFNLIKFTRNKPLLTDCSCRSGVPMSKPEKAPRPHFVSMVIDGLTTALL